MTEGKRLCAQTSSHIGEPPIATVYAMDPIPGGWGGYYCELCADKMRFQVTDYSKEGFDAPTKA